MSAPLHPSSSTARHRRPGKASRHLWRAGLQRTAAVVAVFALAATTVLGGIALAPSSEAAALTPAVTLAPSADGAKGMLAGESETVTLTVANPSADPWYNLSVTLTVPTGVAFVSASGLGTPRVYPAGSRLPDRTLVPAGQDLWVWQDVSDLPSTASRSFEVVVDPAQPAAGTGETDDTTVFPVGSTVDLVARAWTSTDARYVPVFPGGTSRGAAPAVAATLAGDAAPSSTLVQAIRVTKDEPSPESELLRGVHDRTTEYTITVKNTSEGPTTGAVVTDFLPAGLEFLGCGAMDNTTGAREEYAGSGDLAATPVVADCLPASTVTTLEKTAGTAAEFPADLPDGVYTRVTWGPLDLAADQALPIVYAAGIPQRMNTMTWTDGPGPDGLGATGQAANLDNNTGASTRHSAGDPAATDGDVYRNVVTVDGTYAGVVRTGTDRATTDQDDEVVFSMDLRVLKSVDTRPVDASPTPFGGGSSSEFFTGAVAKYTLDLRTSEYADASDITLVDIIPNGLCPVLPAGTTVRSGPVEIPRTDGSSESFTAAEAEDLPADCVPGSTSGSGSWSAPAVTGAVVDWVAYDAVLGRFVLSLSAPDMTGAVDSHAVVYPVLMRGSYTGNEGTTSSLDDFVNTVVMTATTTGLAGDEAGVTATVADDSSARIVAGPSSISKKVLPRAVDVSAGCPADPSLYVEGDDPAASGGLSFVLGDTVCYELTVSFAPDADTRNPVVTDMLPEGVDYVGTTTTLFDGATEIPGVTWNETVNGSTLSWKPSTRVAGNGDRLVPLGSRLVIHVAGTVTGVSEDAAQLDKPENLMKYQQENVRGELFFERDQAAILVEAGLQLVKGVRDVDGDATRPATSEALPDGALVGSDRDGIEVAEGDAITYRVDLTGAREDILGISVEDRLPDGIAAADVSAVSDAGVVETRPDGVFVVWTGLTLPAGTEAAPTAKTLTYVVTVPAETPVTTRLENTASILAYQFLTNAGTPGPVAVPGEDGVSTLGTSDTSDVSLPDVTVAKTVVTTGIEGENNNISGTPVPPATALPQAVHGEYVVYEYAVTVPARTTVLDGVLEDAGVLEAATGSGPYTVDATQSFWLLDGATQPAGFAFDDATGRLEFPAVYDNTTTADQVFTVQVTVWTTGRTTPTAARWAYGDVLQNTATFTSASSTHDATADVEYVVAEPTLTKTVDDGDLPVVAGQVLTYTLTATNTTGRPTSFDTVVTDCVPAALVDVVPGTPTRGTVAPLGTCADGETQIVWTIGDVPAGQTYTLTYTAEVSPAAAGGASYTNTAGLVGYTLPGVDPTDARQLELTSTADATVTVQDASIVKTVDAPSGSIGDTRSFAVTVTLPKNVNFYSPTITDAVPTGLRVVPGSIAVSAVDSGVTFSCTPASGSGTDGGDVVCEASDDILSAPDDRTVTLTYDATIVQDAARTAPARASVLTNVASFAWAATAGATDTTSVEDEATVTVTEPGLTIKKYVEGQDAQDAATAVTAAPSSTVSYSVVVTNPATVGGATAYDVVVTDSIPAGLVDVTLPGTMPAGVLGTVSGGLVTWTIESLAPGATLTLDLTATLEPSAALRSGTTITNTAELAEYWSTPGSGGVEDAAHRQYVGGSDPAVVLPEFPFVTVQKAAGGSPTARVGTPFPWTLTLTNSGNGLAQTVTATDTLPAGWGTPVVTGVTRNGAAMADADWDFDPDAVRWTFADVAPADVIVVGYTSTPTADAYEAPAAGVGPSATGPLNAHTNTVSLTATDSTGEAQNGEGDYVGDDDSADAFLAATEVSILKERVGTGDVRTGEDVAFTLTASTVGLQAAADVVVEDTLPAGLTFAGVDTPFTADPALWSCTVTDETLRCAALDDLAAGDSLSVTVTARAVAPPVGTLSQQVTNTATVTTSTPETGTGSTTDDETITVRAVPSIAIDKRADVAPAGDPVRAVVAGGDDDTQYVLDGQDPERVAHFAITVSNTGPVTLVDVEVEDLAAAQCAGVTIPDLAPAGEDGDSYTFTCEGPAPDASGYTNVAVATATTALGDDVDATDSSRVELSALSIDKTGSIAAVAPVPGDLATFVFEVRNTGSATLTDVTVDDPLDGLSALTFGAWPGDEGTLLPGDVVQATATYPLTREDIDAGGVTNSATASGTDPAGQAPTGEDTVTVTPGSSPSILLVKTGTLATEPDVATVAGDVVTYLFTVTNDGNVTLRDVAISDPLPGLDDLVYDWSAALGEGVLQPGETVTATAGYALTQADVDAGRVDNRAIASGEAPDGTSVDDADTWLVQVDPQPLVDLVKSGELGPDTTGRAGDLVVYTFTVTNPGSVTLTDVEVTDLLDGLSSISYAWPGTAGTLAPGDELVATATYPLTQEDVDRGSVDNTASVVGTPPTGDDVEADDTETVVVPPQPTIALVKKGALAAGSQGLLGDTVEYTLTATNTGNVTLRDLSIEDVDLPGLAPLTLGTWPGDEGVLAPGESVSATTSYVLVQADVERGYVDNLATTAGISPFGSPVDGEDLERVVTLQTPSIVLEKSAALADGQTGVVGDAVDFTFSARNDGNVTLTGVVIADELPGLSEISLVWPGAVGVLLPGEEVTGTAGYVVTQQDVDAGAVVNTAEATGTSPAGVEVTDPAEASVLLPQAPAVDLVKTAALADGATGVAGETVTYSFTVTNTGDVTLRGVRVTDRLPGLSEVVFGAWPGADGELAPGASVDASATYVLTQEDVDRGSVTNVAVATGTPQVGPPVSDDDTATVPTDPRAGISLVKTAALAPGAAGAVGDTVTFTFEVTSRGTATLTSVAVTDALPGLSELTYGSWPAAEGTLAPGESVTATATLVLTQEHVDAGSVRNLATVSGVSPSGGVVSATDEVTLAVPGTPVPPADGADPSVADPAPSGPGTLPWTGAAVTGLAVLAAALLVAGLLLVRRRQATRP
ncbi:conserved repeat protein [Sanguibacter keddieii DSM 10542]|uniref:Conserved repeat protein n=1 Tax=Sanguibacter keddieii (strain ATCC 51767 / DSM 10542 / NCFB 3025 / ST-74) TaxID=446469 RepID=D1BCM6_SANKS|nr:isopeptide-forming domain-containing fimbrial protein [Sanguibacter keddieii]ACZ20874.1 conserved repeat protein [Sanguibacter keddieii DSM 10542]